MIGSAAAATSSKIDALGEIARRHGTPTYAYDLATVDRQAHRVRSALPRSIGLLYSVKANPSLASFLIGRGFGADVSSDRELQSVVDPRLGCEDICLSGPYKSPETLSLLEAVPGAWVSLDSVDEWRRFQGSRHPNPLLLRLRPSDTAEPCATGGFASRFGMTVPEVKRQRASLRATNVRGMHVFAGSQLLDAETVCRYLRQALELSLEVADLLQLAPEVLNLGGGFGVPYREEDRELDVDAVGRDLSGLVERAGRARVILELGRYLVAQAGWYLTSVVGQQTRNGRRAVVVDGGIHQRFDLCGLGVRTTGRAPLVVWQTGRKRDHEGSVATDVLGCLCLPEDVLAEAAQLPRLYEGDILAFPDAGAYGPTAAPLAFLGHRAPAQVVFDGDVISRLDDPALSASSSGHSGRRCPGLRESAGPHVRL